MPCIHSSFMAFNTINLYPGHLPGHQTTTHTQCQFHIIQGTQCVVLNMNNKRKLLMDRRSQFSMSIYMYTENVQGKKASCEPPLRKLRYVYNTIHFTLFIPYESVMLADRKYVGDERWLENYLATSKLPSSKRLGCHQLAEAILKVFFFSNFTDSSSILSLIQL